MSEMTGGRLPGGAVTLLFSDVEGSTGLLQEIGETYGAVLADHDRLLRLVWETHGGAVVDTEGDAFFVAFAVPGAAVAAATAAQEALDDHAWPHGGEFRVRMGLHTGSPQLRGNNYWGVDVHYAARLCAAAHGGQVLLSASTRALVPDAPVDDLGEHALKDFPVARRLFHLRVAGRGAESYPPPRTLVRARTNLPSLPNRLIGRERVIEELRAALTGDVRLLTLSGMGGAGKTRLALACAAGLVDAFADGVFLVRLASTPEEAAVPRAIADALGVHVPEGIPPDAAVAVHLAEREELVIIDNMEHLLGAAPLLSRLLEAAPRLRILVTSQTPLRLSAEVVVPVPPLDVPLGPDANVAELERVAAVALFVERCRAADPSFALDERNAGAVAELCQRLDGLPLALELAAARVRLGGPARLLAALARGIDALGPGARDLPARQRGLRSALDYTVSLLDDTARKVFAASAVFADAWTIEQLEAMFGAGIDTWNAAATLIDFALVRTRGDGRLTMAEPVRLYAQALLADQGHESECRQRHALVLAQEAETISDGLFVDTSSVMVRALELIAEFDAAIQWSGGHNPPLHRRLTAALGVPYYLTNRLSTIADAIDDWAARDDVGDAVSARMCVARAVVLVSRGDVEGAVAAAAEAARCRSRLGDEAGYAVAVAVQAQILNQTNTQDPRASELLTAALALPAVESDPSLLALIRGELAIHQEVMGRIDEAERLLSEIATDSRLTDTFIRMAAMFSWGSCAMASGRFDIALQRFAAVARQVRGNMPLNELSVCMAIAGALAGLKRDADAIELQAATEAQARGVLGAEHIIEEPDSQMLQLFAESCSRLGEQAVARSRSAGRARKAEQLINLALDRAVIDMPEQVGLS